MKLLNQHLLSRHQFLTENPDQPVYLVPFNRHWLSEKSMTLELAHLLFKENMRVVQFPDGVGALSIADRDKLNEWKLRPKKLSNSIFPGFRDMYEDIRNTGLRLAKFDIFYGFNNTTFSGPSDLLIDFYVNVMDAMKHRFYAVPQYFDLRLGADESPNEKQPDAWMFYFEDENDHLVFSALVDLDLQRGATPGESCSLFFYPPKRDEVVELGNLSVLSSALGSSVLSLSSGAVLSAQIMKPTITGKLTHNPDGTVTIEGI